MAVITTPTTPTTIIMAVIMTPTTIIMAVMTGQPMTT